MFWIKITPRIALGILLGTVTLGTNVNQAAALTPLDLIQVPLNLINGNPSQPPPNRGRNPSQPLPNRNIDLFKQNLNSNNLNLCLSSCGTPNPAPRAVPSRTTSPAQVRRPIPPQGSVSSTPTAQPRTTPQTQVRRPIPPQGSVSSTPTAQPQTTSPQSSLGSILSIPQKLGL